MRVPQTRYRIPDFVKDDDWHIINKPEEFPLSRKDPTAVYVGETTQIHSRWGTCTKLKSNWLWRYGFPYASSSYYDGSSSTGSNGSTYFNSLGVGISSYSWYTVNEGNTVQEAYVTSGNNGENITKISSILFQYYYYVGFSPNITYPNSSTNRGVVIRFKANYETDLPSNMYSITNNVITWNDTPILRLLRGFECTPY